MINVYKIGVAIVLGEMSIADLVKLLSKQTKRGGRG